MRAYINYVTLHSLIVYFRANRVQCANADFPDLYGHYREAKFTQTKHHWWWKANRIFEQLALTKHHTGIRGYKRKMALQTLRRQQGL